MRVVGADGKLIGVLKKAEAIEKAKKEGLTLVEIAPNANPPVAKIVDFGKFRYAEEKKARAQARGVKGGEVKEIRFSPFIADNDYQTRIKRIREFLGDKNKVRIVVVFKGRQMNSKPQGYVLLQRIFKEMGGEIATDMEPKFLGKHLITVISPVTKKKTKVVSEDIRLGSVETLDKSNHAKTKNEKIDNK